MSDEARRKILARRASFVAAALASVACGTGCGEPANPRPCLEPPFSPGAPEDAGHEPPPQPCLSPMPPPEPSAASDPPPPAVDAGSPPAVPPHPCLSVRQVPPDAGAPRPQPCLTPKRTP